MNNLVLSKEVKGLSPGMSQWPNEAAAADRPAMTAFRSILSIQAARQLSCVVSRTREGRDHK